ncbi:MAG TPA: isoprenylcysteine carboxylmethyltransferase family protein [Lacibacter sp.]|jgi:protein-S-isoprenylcysteine O-methyltransferase Ste14|nr:isoprenylcysteine carboxylmethyltransferase family protein [Lacibacter sp.]
MVLLLLLWTLYFILHSLLAAEPVKHWLQRVSGLSAQAYRIVYNLFNLAALVAILWLHEQTTSTLLFPGNLFSAVAGVLIIMAGLVLMIMSAREYHLPSFFGFKKETNMPLQVKGLHRYMRHPLYSGTLLFWIGVCIAFPFFKNWFLLLLMIVYLFIGMWLEEKKLIRVFGDEYRNYMKQVKRLIPGIL